MAFIEDGKGISPQVRRADRNWYRPMSCFGEGYVPPGITDARLVERWRARVLHGLIEPPAGHDVAGQKQCRNLHGHSGLTYDS
jgi:hypothetical protein